MADLWQRTLGVPASHCGTLLDVLVAIPGGGQAELVHLISQIRNATGIDLPVSIVFTSPTLADLSAFIQTRRWPGYQRPVTVKSGTGPALFVLPGLGGFGIDTLPLVRQLAFPGPIYLNPSLGIDGSPPLLVLDAVVADHLATMRAVQPHGPYRLLGYSWGGLAAIEVARALRASGETVAFLGMIDPMLNPADWTYGAWLGYMGNRIGYHWKAAWEMRSPPATFRYLKKQLVPTIDKFARLFGFSRLWPLASTANYLPPALAAVWQAESEIIKAYRLRYYDDAVTLFATRSGNAAECDPTKVWPHKVRRFDLQWVPGDHWLGGPAVKDVAAIISDRIAASAVPSGAVEEPSLF